LRTDVVKSPLQPPYSGPYEVVKTEWFLICDQSWGKEITISTERLKPAYIARENSSYKQQSSQPPRTYPGKKKTISFAADLHDNVTGEGVDVGAPTILPTLAAGQKRHVSLCTTGQRQNICGRSDHTSRASCRTAHRPHNRSAMLAHVPAGQPLNTFSSARSRRTHITVATSRIPGKWSV
jgi:hypothetical protein